MNDELNERTNEKENEGSSLSSKKILNPTFMFFLTIFAPLNEECSYVVSGLDFCKKRKNNLGDVSWFFLVFLFFPKQKEEN